MTDNPDDYDEETLVERTDTGVSITTKLKRGTGTRDQDEHTIKAKGHTVDEALDKHAEALDYVERHVTDRSRAIQPEGQDGAE